MDATSAQYRNCGECETTSEQTNCCINPHATSMRDADLGAFVRARAHGHTEAPADPGREGAAQRRAATGRCWLRRSPDFRFLPAFTVAVTRAACQAHPARSTPLLRAPSLCNVACSVLRTLQVALRAAEQRKLVWDALRAQAFASAKAGAVALGQVRTLVLGIVCSNWYAAVACRVGQGAWAQQQVSVTGMRDRGSVLSSVRRALPGRPSTPHPVHRLRMRSLAPYALPGGRGRCPPPRAPACCCFHPDATTSSSCSTLSAW